MPISQIVQSDATRKEPCRVAFCITDLDPGGAEWALFHIVSRLNREFWEPRVYCLGNRGELAQHFEDHGIPTDCYGAMNALDVRVIPWLTGKLREFKPTIVQGFLFHGNIVSRLAGVRAGVPIRIAGHRVAERDNRWHLWIDRLTKRLVNHHVCVSQGVAEHIRSQLRLPEKSVTIIPNGVELIDVPRNENRLHRELDIAPEVKLILAVGRLHRQKGFHDLVEAFQTVSKKFSETHLIIVGEGPERRSLQHQIRRLNLESRVTLTGYRNDLPELMSDTDLFVLSSHWEGMPNVVLQAMAYGVPVVATAVEGTSELVLHERTGIVVSARKPDQLATGISCLLGNSALRCDLSKNAYLHVSNQFTWDSVGAEYERLYKSLYNNTSEQVLL